MTIPVAEANDLQKYLGELQQWAVSGKAQAIVVCTIGTDGNGSVRTVHGGDTAAVINSIGLCHVAQSQLMTHLQITDSTKKPSEEPKKTEA